MNIAINGFGRIGRLCLRRLLTNDQVKVVAVNDLADPHTLHHLLKYDSVHGRLNFDSDITDDVLRVNGQEIKVLSERDPASLPWKDMEIDLVIECTGRFRKPQDLQMHLQAGAGKVVLSAPARGDIKTVVLGVNDHELSADDKIVSNASCTTNCLAPMVKILQDNFGIKMGFMTTVHAYTADQNLQDAPHKDLRRARAAAMSIIPTTTGAAQAVELVIPELKGKLFGMAMRVPTPTGSVTDFTAVLDQHASAEEINAAMKDATNNKMQGIMEYTADPIVSADIESNIHSCIFDSQLTIAEDGMVKVVGWYDNEMGYAARLADLAGKMINMS